jgi:hypothetical protein
MDPNELEWGTATPEASNPDRRIALHVLNVSLEDPPSVDRVIRFTRARWHFFSKQLPQGWRQAVRFDDRGQSLSDSVRTRIKASFPPDSVSFFTEPYPPWLTT